MNYIPLYPKGENADTLEAERVVLESEVKKSDNEMVIKAKMKKTFAHRRSEIVDQKPRIADVKVRWPALFTLDGVSMTWVLVLLTTVLTLLTLFFSLRSVMNLCVSQQSRSCPSFSTSWITFLRS